MQVGEAALPLGLLRSAFLVSSCSFAPSVCSLSADIKIHPDIWLEAVERGKHF